MGLVEGAAIAGLLLNAGSMTYGAIKQSEAADEARRLKEDQLKQAQENTDRLTAENKKITDQQEEAARKAAALLERDDSKKRQQSRLAPLSGGRRGTILTSPLGEVGGGASQPRRTILGG